MKTNEIVEIIKDSKPNLLNGISDKKAARIINIALAQIKLEIETTSEGKVVVPGFGVFNVKKVEKAGANDEKQTTERIIFGLPKN